MPQMWHKDTNASAGNRWTFDVLVFSLSGISFIAQRRKDAKKEDGKSTFEALFNVSFRLERGTSGMEKSCCYDVKTVRYFDFAQYDTIVLREIIFLNYLLSSIAIPAALLLQVQPQQ